MKWPWRNQTRARMEPVLLEGGVSFELPSPPIDGVPDLASCPETERPLAAYLGQLLNEGRAELLGTRVTIPWDVLFNLLADEEQATSVPLLTLPEQGDWVPCLMSSGTPSEPAFTVTVAGWQSPHWGRRDLDRAGGVIRLHDQSWLLSQSAWQVCRAIESFQQCSSALSSDERLHALGEIRARAISAGAVLDDYLERTDIVASNKLSLELRRHAVANVPVIEVVPRPVGAPEGFVDQFDRYDAVRKRYDVVGNDGRLAHVVPSPAITSALAAIKAMPGRRVASAAARLFARNPFSVLGDEARDALDEDDLARARNEAELLPYRLEFRSGDEGASAQIDLFPLLDSDSTKSVPLTRRVAARILDQAGQSRARRLPLFLWEGYEIELDPVTEHALAQLADWATRRAAAEVGITLADITNLEAYSDRVVGFDAKVQTIPYVARRDAGAGWVPENVETGITVVDGASGDVSNVAMTPQALTELEASIGRAVESGAREVALPGSPARISVDRAQELVGVLRAANISVGNKRVPATSKDPAHKGSRPSLRILHNIEDLDYAKEYGDSSAAPGDVAVPVALRSGVSLLPHQEAGVAWLQHQYARQQVGVSGCLLADDMGLGKTLQSLCLIAWHLERGSVKPCLIVAPVSLLENWKQEIRKFLDWAEDDVLSLYGDALSPLRLDASRLDPGVTEAGIRKLLRPGFEDGFRIVLTTYETLRDYELSLARVDWGIVVCDEAQKIKNPAAFVTQAAKALRCDFRIACTGTPVENSLADLWCLFDFFQPGYLGSLNQFTKEFRRDIETRAEGHPVLVERLRSATRPWVLRRMKGEVHQGLPEKFEGTRADPASSSLPMSALQSTLYREAVAAYRAAKTERDAAKRVPILALLSRLRLICANPLSLVAGDHESRPISEHLSVSPKLAWLLDRLTQIQCAGEKVIVFTEFREIQRLIQRAVSSRFSQVPQIINGSTTVDPASDESRQRVIDRFQNAPGFGVLILSTTAVGFGVNIQAANHVIHFTRPWNPAKEDQATDRAYRIGQSRDVFVYFPTVVGAGFESFEERLANLLESKRELSRDMLAGTQEITADDFIDL